MILEGAIAGLAALLSPVIGAAGSVFAGVMQAAQTMTDLVRFSYQVLHDAYIEVTRFRSEQPLAYLMMGAIFLTVFMWMDTSWQITDGIFNPSALGLNPDGTLWSTQMDLPKACHPTWGSTGESFGWSGSTGWEGVGTSVPDARVAEGVEGKTDICSWLDRFVLTLQGRSGECLVSSGFGGGSDGFR